MPALRARPRALGSGLRPSAASAKLSRWAARPPRGGKASQHCESRPHKSKRARGEGGFRRSHGGFKTLHSWKDVTAKVLPGVPCLVSTCSNRLSALVSSLLGACLTRRVQSYDSQLESSPICYTVLVPGFLAWQPRLRASHAPSLALTPRGP